MGARGHSFPACLLLPGLVIPVLEKGVYHRTILNTINFIISAPSGSPTNFHVTNFTHNEINVTWSPPEPAERNGVINKYQLCIRNDSYTRRDGCLQRVTVNSSQTSYTFRKLRPYRRHRIRIRAATKVNFGPSRVIVETTAQAG